MNSRPATRLKPWPVSAGCAMSVSGAGPTASHAGALAGDGIPPDRVMPGCPAEPGDPAGRSACAGSGDEVEAVVAHDLVPRRHEVPHERVLGIVGGIGLGGRP